MDDAINSFLLSFYDQFEIHYLHHVLQYPISRRITKLLLLKNDKHESNKSGIILQWLISVFHFLCSGQMMLTPLILVLLGATLTESCFIMPGPRNWMSGGYGGYGGWMSPLASFYSLGPKPGCPPKQPATREEQLRCFTGRTCTERQELNINRIRSFYYWGVVHWFLHLSTEGRSTWLGSIGTVTVCAAPGPRSGMASARCAIASRTEHWSSPHDSPTLITTVQAMVKPRLTMKRSAGEAISFDKMMGLGDGVKL